MTPLTANDVRSFLIAHLSTPIATQGLKEDAITDDFDLLGSGVIDSLGIIELISAVEHQFKVTVDFEKIDPAEMTVVGPFCRFVAAYAVKSP